MKDDDLGMGLFGDGEPQELDMNFGPTSDEENTTEEGTDDVFAPPVEEKENLGDGENPQESVAENGGDEEEGQPSGDDTSPNVYHDLAAVFKEQGLLSSTDNTEIKDLDGFISAFKSEIKKSEFADLSDSQKEYLEAVRSGVPQARVQEHQETQLNLEKITSDAVEENQELRRRIIYQNLVNQGLSDNDATKFVQRSVDNNLDVEDALDALPSIKEYNKAQYNKEVEDAKKAEANRLKAIEKEKADLRDAIMTPDEVFEGYQVSPHVKEAVYKEMNTVVNYNEEGKPENSLLQYKRENPVEFDAKLYYLFSLTNGFKDLKKFSSKGTSSAVSNLERTLQGGSFRPQSGNPSFIDNPEGYSGFGDELVIE